jgi:hypothetical protein
VILQTYNFVYHSVNRLVVARALRAYRKLPMPVRQVVRDTVIEPAIRAITPGWGALGELRNYITEG